MSSTNRSNVRRANDFYETPDWVTDAILPHLGKFTSALDPCAGKGAILRRVFKHDPRVALFGLEIDPARAALSPDTETRDACSSLPWPRTELIITNPPFSLAILSSEPWSRWRDAARRDRSPCCCACPSSKARAE